MKKTILGLLALMLFSCGGKSGPKVYPVKEESFSKFINNKNLPNDPNLNLDKSIVNNDYPIQIALYRNHKFYYDLPNLDDGTGTWSYTNGQIVLKSKHRLFDMRIDIHSLDENGNKLAIKFIDRHGPQTLKMANSLIE
jgi:hypothetical protein